MKNKDKIKALIAVNRLTVVAPEGKTEDKDMDNVESSCRGVPKSGRVWKTVRKERYSTIQNVKSLHSSWSKKMEAKALQKNLRLHEKELKESVKKEKESQRLRAEENQKRKLENQRKSEVVQVIKDTRKIKRMKKKQLRSIEKR